MKATDIQDSLEGQIYAFLCSVRDDAWRRYLGVLGRRWGASYGISYSERRDMAEEIAQDGIRRFLEALGRHDLESRPSDWPTVFWGCMRFAYLDFTAHFFHQGMTGTDPKVQAIVTPTDPGLLPETPCESGATPFEDVFRSEKAMEIRKAINKLPPQQAAVVSLWLEDPDLTDREIAQLLSKKLGKVVKAGTVKVTRFRAFRGLGKLLKGQQGGDFVFS